MAKEDSDPKKKRDQADFERELDKLKLSAEHGVPFSQEKKLENQAESEEDFLQRMKEMEEAMRNPDEREIKEILGSPNFPKVDVLSDKEVSAALDMVKAALENKNIILNITYPTPDREIYRFITEELLHRSSGMAGAGGMIQHYIYEEFYPNYEEDIKADVADFLNFICGGHGATLPWRIDSQVKLHGEIVKQDAFEALINDHRNIFQGMSFIGVDSVKIDFKPPKAQADVTFRFYLDATSGTPGENSATATFHFKLAEKTYWLQQAIIDTFGIQ